MKRRNFIFGLSGLLSFFGFNRLSKSDTADIVKPIPYDSTKAFDIWNNKKQIEILIDNVLRQHFNSGVWYSNEFSTISSSSVIKIRYLRDNRIDIVSRCLQVLCERLVNSIKDNGFNSFGKVNIEYIFDYTEMKIIANVDVQNN